MSREQAEKDLARLVSEVADVLSPAMAGAEITYLSVYRQPCGRMDIEMQGRGVIDSPESSLEIKGTAYTTARIGGVKLVRTVRAWDEEAR